MPAGYVRATQSIEDGESVRHPTRILYVRYSSRSCGASLFRGSCAALNTKLSSDASLVFTYEFDGDLLVVEQVCALEDDAERTFTDLLADPVMHTNNV